MRRSTGVAISAFVWVTGSLTVWAGSNAMPTKSIYQAAGDGDMEQLNLHLAKGTNLNREDLRRYTPLKHAIEGHHVEAAKLMIEKGANVNTKDSDGMTPLIFAVINRDPNMAQMLLEKGADMKGRDTADNTALHHAARYGQMAIVEILVTKGADVNAKNKAGQNPLAIALQYQTNQPEMAALLRKHGAQEPATAGYGPYGDSEYGAGQATAQPGLPAPVQRIEIEIDPNQIMEQMKQFQGLAASLKTIDAKSENEQRAWIQQRTDNRTTLLSTVERQFNDELAWLKPLPVEEKAHKTIKAIDDLSAARKKRYATIATELRDQRRATLQESRNSMATNQGTTMGRGARGRSAATGAAGSTGGYSATGPYGNQNSRMPTRRATAADANEPPIDPDTQSQSQAWLNAKADDKTSLLQAVHELDLVELDALARVAEEEKAMKTNTAVLGLMMVRQQRIEKITVKWQEEDARQQKLQERYGTQQPGMQGGRGMRGGQQQQQGMRRPTR